jgi:hypothetical protein
MKTNGKCILCGADLIKNEKTKKNIKEIITKCSKCSWLQIEIKEVKDEFYNNRS